jgi:hypothetical protein
VLILATLQTKAAPEQAGDADHIVMFCQPKAPVTPPLRVLRQVQRIAQSICRRSAFRNKCEIKNRKRRHTASAVRMIKKKLGHSLTCDWPDNFPAFLSFLMNIRWTNSTVPIRL